MTYNRFKQDPALRNYIIDQDAVIVPLKEVDKFDIWVGRIRDWFAAIGMFSLIFAVCFFLGSISV